jgi:hypothetical protein
MLELPKEVPSSHDLSCIHSKRVGLIYFFFDEQIRLIVNYQQVVRHIREIGQQKNPEKFNSIYIIQIFTSLGFSI